MLFTQTSIYHIFNTTDHNFWKPVGVTLKLYTLAVHSGLNICNICQISPQEGFEIPRKRDCVFIRMQGPKCYGRVVRFAAFLTRRKGPKHRGSALCFLRAGRIQNAMEGCPVFLFSRLAGRVQNTQEARFEIFPQAGSKVLWKADQND